MADEFTPITTREDFDKAVEARVNAERSKVEERYKDYDTLKQQNADLSTRVKGYETSALKAKVAKEVGLPDGCAELLAGEDEAAIKKHAEALKTVFGVKEQEKKTPPRKDTESGGSGTGKRAALKRMLDGLKGD